MSTIVAISTAPAIGGIGIVRISGDKSFEILEKIFIQKNPQDIKDIKGYRIKYGKITKYILIIMSQFNRYAKKSKLDRAINTYIIKY